MVFTRFLKDSNSDGIGVQIIDESVGKDEFVSDYYEGIYTVVSYGYSFFDVTFIPNFERKTDLWHQHGLFDYEEEDITSSQEARLLTSTDNRYAITPDANRAGTKQDFTVPLTSEQEANIKLDRLDLKDFTERTIYYVTPRDFYTFRGELVTLKSEKSMTNLDLINLKEILDFSFMRFILDKIIPVKKLQELEEKADIDLIKV